MPPAPPKAEKGLAPGVVGLAAGVVPVGAGVVPAAGAAPPISCENMLFILARPAAGAAAGVAEGVVEGFVVLFDVVDAPHGFGNGSVLTVVLFSVVPVLVLLLANDEKGFCVAAFIIGS